MCVPQSWNSRQTILSVIFFYLIFFVHHNNCHISMFFTLTPLKVSGLLSLVPWNEKERDSDRILAKLDFVALGSV